MILRLHEKVGKKRDLFLPQTIKELEEPQSYYMINVSANSITGPASISGFAKVKPEGTYYVHGSVHHHLLFKKRRQ